MKTPEQLRKEILLNGELREAFIKAQESNTVAQFLAEHDTEADEASFVASIDGVSTPPMTELSDDDMAKAVGGVKWADGGKGWDHFWEVEYLFKSGDRVYVSGGYTGTIDMGFSLRWGSYYYPRYFVYLDGYEGFYEYWQNWLAPM